MIGREVAELDDDEPIPRIAAWIYLLVGAAVLAGALVVLRIVDATRGPRPAFVEEGWDAPVESPAPVHDSLLLAGSGSNLPLTRELAGGFAALGEPSPVVHASI